MSIGVGSLDAPVLDAFGGVAAAVSIGELLACYNGERKALLVQLIKDTAVLISKALRFGP